MEYSEKIYGTRCAMYLKKTRLTHINVKTIAFWKLEAQVGQKSLTWIRLILICYIVPWWPSWISDQIAISNSDSDVVLRV